MSRKLVLLLAASVMCASLGAYAEALWTFDCNTEGWWSWNNVELSWKDVSGGKLSYIPNGLGDPHAGVRFNQALADHQYLRFSMDGTGIPVADATGMVYLFTEAGHAGIRFDLVEGSNIYMIDLVNATVEDDGGGQGGTTLSQFRLDLPQDGPEQFEGFEFVIDWVYLGTDNAFVPAAQDTADCSMVSTSNAYTAWKVSTAPNINGYIEAGEYPDYPLYLNNISMASMRGTRLNYVQDDTDISGIFWFAWDDTWFYCAARVTDTAVEYLADQGQALNGTDCIQLCTDHQYLHDDSMMNDEPGGVNIHDVAPGQASDPNTAAYWQHWGPPDEIGYPDSFPNSQFAGHTDASGNMYEVELAIKWSDFDPNPPTPYVGMQMGYMAMLLDTDGGALSELWWNAGNGVNQIGGPVSTWATMTLGADPNDPDGDGLSNDEETALGTDPENPDTDGDGLSDGAEVNQHGTSPLLVDTDDDGVSDPMELTFGSDPTDPLSVPGLPVASYAGIALLVVLLAGAGVVLTLRLRKRLS